MKKAHFALLVITAITALSSAYSLAAINQVHRVDYEWYSQYEGRFTSKHRDTFGYKNNLKKGMKDFMVAVAGSREELEPFAAGMANNYEGVYHTDFDRFILLCCSLGEVSSPGYRIKIADIAQRGGSVEVRVCINSPDREMIRDKKGYSHFPLDIVRIDKLSLKPGGKLNFIIKDQDGRQLAVQSVSLLK